MWKYVIPEPKDPNNSPVTMNVSLSSQKIFTYDKTTNTITQNEEQEIAST